jgi:amino acid transporter
VAALLSTLVLVLIYVIVSIAAQSFHGATFLTNNSDDVLNALAKAVLGSPWNKLLIIAVLTSASASTQTTILPAARSSLSMAVHKAFPARFASINPRYLSPGFSTLLFGAVSIVWYVVLTLISPNVLENSILALGFGIAFYYAMTGYACVVYYRRQVFNSLKNFVFIGLAPLIGALILTWAFIDSIFVYSNPANSAGRAWFTFIHFNVHILGVHLYAHGVGSALVIGLGLLLIGVPIMLVWRIKHPDFFKRDREVAESLDASAPPLTPGVLPVTD